MIPIFTAQQIFDITCDLINKRQANGIINASTTAIYKARAPGILTLWQSEIAKSGDLYATHEISNKPIPNMLGLLKEFNITEHVETDLTYEAIGKAKAYYFEVDGPATVYVEDYTTQWNTLATIIVPDTVESFTGYKGVVTPTTGATRARLRFSGSYYYRTINRALFSYPFQADRVPDYRPWIKKEMPSDFKSIDQIVSEFPERQYQKESNYRWEERKNLYINYYFEGNYRVVYKPVPIPITSLTQTLQVDEISSMSGAYFLASHLLLVEDPDSASYFNQRYEELKMESNIKTPATATQIIDIYGITTSMGG